MNKLMQFLLENPIDNIKASVDIGGRLTGMKFSIQPITDTQIDEANLKATKHGKSARVKTSIMHTEIILAGCTEPNFRDEGSITKMGVSTPEAFINKILLPGEKADLATEILKLSGYDDDENEVVQEAKNS